MATDIRGGVVDGRHSDDCKRDIGPRLKSQLGYNLFLLIFVRIHTRCDFLIYFLSLHKPRGAKPEHTSCPDKAAPSCPDH